MKTDYTESQQYYSTEQNMMFVLSPQNSPLFLNVSRYLSAWFVVKTVHGIHGTEDVVKEAKKYT